MTQALHFCVYFFFFFANFSSFPPRSRYMGIPYAWSCKLSTRRRGGLGSRTRSWRRRDCRSQTSRPARSELVRIWMASNMTRPATRSSRRHTVLSIRPSGWVSGWPRSDRHSGDVFRVSLGFWKTSPMSEDKWESLSPPGGGIGFLGVLVVPKGENWQSFFLIP